VFPRVLDHACYLVNILVELRNDIHANDHTPSFIFEKLLVVSSVLLQTARGSPQMNGERLVLPASSQLDHADGIYKTSSGDLDKAVAQPRGSPIAQSFI
jgi:hypothetical protein